MHNAACTDKLLMDLKVPYYTQTVFRFLVLPLQTLVHPTIDSVVQGVKEEEPTLRIFVFCRQMQGESVISDGPTWQPFSDLYFTSRLNCRKMDSNKNRKQI